MRFKNKYKILFEPVFKTTVLFVVGDFDYANKTIKRYGLIPMSEEIRQAKATEKQSRESDEGVDPEKVEGTVYTIWLKDKKDFYSLLHETDHLVIDIFEDKGIKINYETTELFAYLQEYWFKKLWHQANKNN